MKETHEPDVGCRTVNTLNRLRSKPPVVGSATGSAAASEAEKELTPMEDALLMLELWDTAIRKHIKVQPQSPIHRLVKVTIERLKQPNDQAHRSAPEAGVERKETHE